MLNWVMSHSQWNKNFSEILYFIVEWFIPLHIFMTRNSELFAAPRAGIWRLMTRSKRGQGGDIGQSLTWKMKRGGMWMICDAEISWSCLRGTWQRCECMVCTYIFVDNTASLAFAVIASICQAVNFFATLILLLIRFQTLTFWIHHLVYQYNTFIILLGRSTAICWN